MGIELINKPSLAQHTTLRLGGTAEVKAVVRTASDLDELCEFLTTHPLRPFVIGEGSNILAPDAHLEMVLIHVDNPTTPEHVSEHGNTVTVRCPASQRLPALLAWAQKKGLSGLEGLAGIPGSLGGCVAMNAGSYGTEIKDVLARIHLWTPQTGLQWLKADQCEFAYRHFSCPLLSASPLVWEVELTLTKSTPTAVQTRVKETYAQKRATQPVTARSAGCVFKNPDGQSAGQLLEQAGMKGATVGEMGFSDIHANFLVNHGKGSSTEAMALIEKGKVAVKEQFDSTLEMEVIIL